MHSHTNNTDIEHRLNEAADRAAKTGAQGHCTPGIRITECYEYLPIYFLTTADQGHVIETGTHAEILDRMDAACLRSAVLEARDRELAGKTFCKAILNLRDTDVWLEAASSTIKEGEIRGDVKGVDAAALEAFKAKLTVMKLRSPYNKGVTNRSKYPGLYCLDTCEVCNGAAAGRPDELHYICRCPEGGTRQARHAAAQHVSDMMAICTGTKDTDGRINPGPTVCAEQLLTTLFPGEGEVHTFTFGLANAALKERIDQLGLPGPKMLAVQSRVQTWVTQAMHKVWVASTETQKDAGLVHQTRMADYLRAD